MNASRPRACRLRRNVAVGALLALISMPMAQAAQTPPSLHVQAQSSVEAAPDKATLNARLWEKTPAHSTLEDSDGDALTDARARLERRVGELITTMEDSGLERDAISAGSLSIYPEQVQGARSDNGDGETLQRTRLERPVTVELTDLDQLGEVLDALMGAGVNALDGVQFDLQNRDAATDEALVKALEKARHKAELMADTLGADIGHVQHIEETQSPIFQPRMMSMRTEQGASADANSAPRAEYRPGTIRIDAGVNVTWTLKGPDAPDHPDSDAAAQE
ncbi:SIMPL domain-containing protein [Halomonas sp. CUBES01]|uniref:SIMPL domain-containing protein n=1 Tax=Vreelandella gomseomensis TaxID=370766 RepID=A0ABU1GDM2_9GAMM|nr:MULTISPECIES: SIMPL domain-containing protein [Halomonas]MDR5875593.1 SIMPL domain-containing protein [Halomonas gomseomensis]MEC4767794.1 SIMPL domain-containing protein [Halomonas sp. CUBES01]